MQDDTVPSEISRKPCFRTGVIVINLVIPIYVICHEFPTTIIVTTDSGMLSYFSVHQRILYHIGNVACLLDLVVSSSFFVTVTHGTEKRSFGTAVLAITIIWTVWNSLRLLFEVVKFIENLPSQDLNLRYDSHVLRLVSAVYSATEVALRMASIPIVVLHYRWMNSTSSYQRDVGEIPLVGSEDPSVHAHGAVENIPRRKKSWFTLRTVLITVNSVPVFAIVLAVLPTDIAWLALNLPTSMTAMTSPMLITRIAVDIFEILLSFSILICMWANLMKTKMFKMAVVVIWFIWHVVRIILQFVCCVWMSLLSTELQKGLDPSFIIRWRIASVTKEYITLILWIICLVSVISAAFKDLMNGDNVSSQSPSQRMLSEATHHRNTVPVS